MPIHFITKTMQTASTKIFFVSDFCFTKHKPVKIHTSNVIYPHQISKKFIKFSNF